MVEAGVLLSGAGKVRLLRPHELPEDWVPDSDTRLIAWEAVHHHLVRVHRQGRRGLPPPRLMSKLGARMPRPLASWPTASIASATRRTVPKRPLSYNALVQSWPEVARLAQQVDRPTAGVFYQRGRDKTMTAETIISTMVAPEFRRCSALAE